jgi:hypothetical protein
MPQRYQSWAHLLNLDVGEVFAIVLGDVLVFGRVCVISKSVDFISSLEI